MMASEDLSNFEIYGIQNDKLRYAYTAYLLFVMLSSLIGDSFILVGTLKYQAIEINSFLVVLIQNIAVVDIFTCITCILPPITSLLCGRWVLGGFYCQVNSIAPFYIFSVNQLLISCMAFIKVLMVKFRDIGVVRNLTRRKAQIMCLLVWMVSLTTPVIVHVIENGAEVYFDARDGICKINRTSELWTVIQPLLAMIYSVAPLIVTIVSTILLVQHLIISRRLSRRIGSRQTWHGILIVCITAAIFIVTTLPNFIYESLAPYHEDMTGFLQNHFLRITAACYSLNLVCNFYIYTLTLPSFRKFVIRAVHSFTSFWQKGYASLCSNTTGYSISET